MNEEEESQGLWGEKEDEKGNEFIRIDIIG